MLADHLEDQSLHKCFLELFFIYNDNFKRTLEMDRLYVTMFSKEWCPNWDKLSRNSQVNNSIVSFS